MSKLTQPEAEALAIAAVESEIEVAFTSPGGTVTEEEILSPVALDPAEAGQDGVWTFQVATLAVSTDFSTDPGGIVRGRRKQYRSVSVEETEEGDPTTSVSDPDFNPWPNEYWPVKGR